MAKDLVGPPAAAPVVLVQPLEIRPIAAAGSGARNGMPEPVRYVYGAAGARRAREVARILAQVRAQLGQEGE